MLFLYREMEEMFKIKTNEPNKELVDFKVTCKYLRSIFGAALSILNQCTGQSYRSVRDELQSLEFEDILLLLESRRLNDFTLPIPKELQKLCTHIMEFGAQTPNIFLKSGTAASHKLIREKIDTNEPLTQDDDIYAVAGVLIDFLATLITPILPQAIVDDIIQQYELYGDTDDMILQQLMFRLPKDNSQAFMYLVSFFKQLLL